MPNFNRIRRARAGYPARLAAAAPYLQAVASYGLPLQGNRSGGFTGGVEHVSRTVHLTGPSAFTSLQIGDTDLYGGNFAASGYNGTIERTVYIPGAPTPLVKLTYGGAAVGTLNSGTVLLMSDPLYPSQFGLSQFPANTQIATMGQFKWLADVSFAYQIIGNSAGFGHLQLNPTSAFADYMNATSISGGVYCHAPVAIVGTPVTPHVSVLAIGDSLIQSYNPGGSNTNLYNEPLTGKGWFGRAMYNLGIPWTNLGSDGNSSGNFLSSNGQAILTALAPYFTHFISDCGHNGYGTASAEFARAQQLWTLVKNASGSKIRHIEQVAILPDTYCGITLTSLTSSGTTATANYTSPAPLSAGNTIRIGAANPSAYAGTFVLTAATSSTLQFTLGSAPGVAASSWTSVSDANSVQGNQTPKGGFEANGTSFKDTFNASLASAVGQGLLDAVYKHSAIEPVPGQFLCNGQANYYVGDDGTHPTSNGLALMATGFQARAATWT